MKNDCIGAEVARKWCVWWRNYREGAKWCEIVLKLLANGVIGGEMTEKVLGSAEVALKWCVWCRNNRNGAMWC